MEAVIISKTKMKKGCCVGAILFNGEGIRLLDENGFNQSFDTAYQIGQIWDLTFTYRDEIDEPHNEDVLVSNAILKGKVQNLRHHLEKVLNVKIWTGSHENLFDGKIHWTKNKGSGYISERTGIPTHSVGFYLLDSDITLEDGHYYFEDDELKRLDYVGFQPQQDTISAGTLIRVSLARWWKPDDIDIEERCYAQLSGWY